MLTRKDVDGQAWIGDQRAAVVELLTWIEGEPARRARLWDEAIEEAALIAAKWASSCATTIRLNLKGKPR